MLQERGLAARIVEALGSSDAGDTDEEEGGNRKRRKPEVSNLLGILQMKGNLPAQKAAAEQLAQEVSGIILASSRRQDFATFSSRPEVEVEFCDNAVGCRRRKRISKTIAGYSV